jgi:hypothetical protein
MLIDVNSHIIPAKYRVALYKFNCNLLNYDQGVNEN